MNNDWTEFAEGSYEQRRLSPRVLLSAEKRFRFSAKALEILGEPKAVRFLFDVGRNRIGIRSEAPDHKHAFLVRRDPRGRTAVVNASPFCARFGIKPESTIAFDDIRLDDEGTLILDLATAKRAVR